MKFMFVLLAMYKPLSEYLSPASPTKLQLQVTSKNKMGEKKSTATM